MAPRKLAFSGKKNEDVKGFFFQYSLYEMASKSTQGKALALVCYLEDEALSFYLEMLTDSNDLQEERKDYSNV